MDGLSFRFSRLSSAAILFLFCATSVNALTYKSTVVVTPVPGDSAEIGVLGGFNTSHTNGNITASGAFFPSAIAFQGSGTSTNGEIGLQFREIFYVNSIVEPYVYINAVSMSGNTSSMNMGPLIAGAQSSTVVSNQNWIARIGVGFQAPTGISHVVGGFGIGVSVFGQALTTNVNEPGIGTTSFRSYSKIFQPTIMANLSWQFCQSCIGGFPGSLAAQFSAESYRKTNVKGTTATGNIYAGTLNQHWVPHGDLILSVRFPT